MLIRPAHEYAYDFAQLKSTEYSTEQFHYYRSHPPHNHSSGASIRKDTEPAIL